MTRRRVQRIVALIVNSNQWEFIGTFRSRRSVTNRRPFGVRVLVLVLSLTLVWGSLGMPAPRLNIKDRSQPFPCMDHQCGCVDADTCWGDCCCFSVAEKLEWAKQHHVDVPDSAATESRSTPSTESCSSHPTCCTSTPMDHHQTVAKRSCCSTKKESSPEKHTHLEPNEPSGSTIVLLVRARGCGGQEQLRMILNEVAPMTISEMELMVSCVAIKPFCESPFIGVDRRPPTPPPWSVACS